MRPELFSIGIFRFHPYTMAIAIAFLVCVLQVMKQNYKLKEPYPITPIAGLWIFFGAFIGARAYHIVQYGEIGQIYRAIFIWESGLVYYGGLIGGILGCIIYMKWVKAPLLPVADIALPYLALGTAIVRIGCFLNGCCWGRPAHVHWAVVFPRNSFAYKIFENEKFIGYTDAVPLHPTQLYNSAAGLLCFLIMRQAYKRLWREGAPPKSPYLGVVTLLYPLLYGISRFTTEIYRGDSVRSVQGMTVSQTVSLLCFAGAALMLAWKWRLHRRALAAAPASDHAPTAPQ